LVSGFIYAPVITAVPAVVVVAAIAWGWRR
jgi:hypothetical protein